MGGPDQAPPAAQRLHLSLLAAERAVLRKLLPHFMALVAAALPHTLLPFLVYGCARTWLALRRL